MVGARAGDGKGGEDERQARDRLAVRMLGRIQRRERYTERVASAASEVYKGQSYNNDGVSIAATFLLPDCIDETLIPVATVFRLAYVRPSLRKRCVCSVGNRFLALWTQTK